MWVVCGVCERGWGVYPRFVHVRHARVVPIEENCDVRNARGVASLLIAGAVPSPGVCSSYSAGMSSRKEGLSNPRGPTTNPTFFFGVGVNDPLAAPTLDDIRGAIRSLPTSPTYGRDPIVLEATDRAPVLSSVSHPSSSSVFGTGSATVSGWDDPQTPISSNRDRSDANACSVAGEAEEPAPSLASKRSVAPTLLARLPFPI